MTLAPNSRLHALHHTLSKAKRDFAAALQNINAAQQEMEIETMAYAYTRALRQYRIALMGSCTGSAIPRRYAAGRMEIGRVRQVA
jgi:hypothetical protein